MNSKSPKFTSPTHLVIGMTGGIGCGKSTIAQEFSKLGAATLDTDQIAHELCATKGAAIPTITDTFGPNYITDTGALNRSAMRCRIFSDPRAKKMLESILHPLIHTETQKQAEKAQGAYLIIMVPLLIESEDWKECFSRILLVDCPQSLQINRVKTRNNLSHDEVLSIIANQASREQRIKATNDILINVGRIETLLPQIRTLHAQYVSLAQRFCRIN